MVIKDPNCQPSRTQLLLVNSFLFIFIFYGTGITEVDCAAFSNSFFRWI